MLRFLVFGVGRTCSGSARVGVYKCVGGGVVVHLSVWMESALLPPGSFFGLRLCAACVRIGWCRVGGGMGWLHRMVVDTRGMPIPLSR